MARREVIVCDCCGETNPEIVPIFFPTGTEQVAEGRELCTNCARLFLDHLVDQLPRERVRSLLLRWIDSRLSVLEVPANG